MSPTWTIVIIVRPLLYQAFQVQLSMLGRMGLVLVGGGGGGLLAIDYRLYNNINTAAADKH